MSKLPLRLVVSQLTNAINIGAPVYNTGDHQKCFEIYLQTAFSLIDQNPEGKDVLEGAVNRALGQESSTEKAWTMRKAFDSLIQRPQFAQPSTALGAPQSARPFTQPHRGATDTSRAPTDTTTSPDTNGVASGTLLDFAAADSVRSWRALNDNVMGGRSQCTGLAWSNGAGVFKGETSLANNGGFASVRTSQVTSCHPQGKGLLLEVATDGRGYVFTCKDNAGRVSYWSPFSPPASATFSVLRLPFAQMVPKVFGTQVVAPMITPTRILEWGIMCYDGQGGPFELKIKSIKSY